MFVFKAAVVGAGGTGDEIAEGMDISEEEVAKTLSISQSHLSLDAASLKAVMLPRRCRPSPPQLPADRNGVLMRAAIGVRNLK